MSNKRLTNTAFSAWSSGIDLKTVLRLLRAQTGRSKKPPLGGFLTSFSLIMLCVKQEGAEFGFITTVDSTLHPLCPPVHICGAAFPFPAYSRLAWFWNISAGLTPASSIMRTIVASRNSSRLCSNSEPIGWMDVTPVSCSDLAVGALIHTVQSASLPIAACG